MTAQVERLIGRSLRDVAAVDFEVSVQHVAGRPTPWTLVVRTLVPDTAIEPRTRELNGASCAEVTDAAAVAIAMVVQEQDSQLRIAVALYRTRRRTRRGRRAA